MLWIKRFVFILFIIIVFTGYFILKKITIYREEQLARRYAKLTALSWINAALYDNDPEKYRKFRDSLLKANGSSVEDVEEYLKLYNRAPENYIYFATLLNTYVDSLCKREDSLSKAKPELPKTSGPAKH